MAVGACQSFQFFRQLTWYFGNNNRALSKFRYQILHHAIRIIRLKKKSVHKSQFYISHGTLIYLTEKSPWAKIY